MAEATPPESSGGLTEEDLRDTVIVAEAATVPEMIFMTELLEADGIPVLSHGSNTVVYMRGSEMAIRVPRRFVARARTLIDTARSRVDEKRIDDAFDPQVVEGNLATHDPKRDPVMDMMFRLRDQPFEFREMELRKHVWNWLVDGRSSLDIATHLAAAGLTQDQAATLVDTVTHEQADEIASQRQKRADKASVLILLGGVLFVGLIVLALVTQAQFVVILYGPLIAGLVALHRYSQPMAKIPHRQTWDGT